MATGGLQDVYIKLPTGKSVQYDVPPSTSIGAVCDRVAKAESVLESQVRLKYQGKVLNKTHSLSYLGVRAETILKAEILVPKLVTIKVEFQEGRREEFNMKNIDALSSLQGRIAAAESVPVSRVVLKSEGRQLRGVSLMDAGIVDESVVKVEIRDEAAPSKDSRPQEERKEAIGQEDLTKILSSFDNSGRHVEVVFSFDTTGSMYSCLDEVRRNLRDCCTRLLQDIPNIRIGLIAHGDYCDQYCYVVRSIDLTSDVQSLVDFANNVPATGGGDAPECYEWSLRKAQQLDWSEDSAKALVVIGDELPHPPSYTDQHVDWHEELDLLTGMGVKVYGVQAFDNSQVRPFYEELSERSGGCYLSLKHFSVITDMFLAVCYRESDESQLEAFAREIEETGQMTEEKKVMFKQLEEKPSQPENKTKRYVSSPWWDHSIATGRDVTPSYSYLQETDKWVSYQPKGSTRKESKLTSSPDTSPISVSSGIHSCITLKHKKHRRHKRGCVLM